jgi:hypothetical protein
MCFKDPTRSRVVTGICFNKLKKSQALVVPVNFNISQDGNVENFTV